MNKMIPIVSFLCLVFSVEFTSAQTCLSDDFDPDIDTTQWSANTGIASTSCGADSGNGLYFTNIGIRAATTKALNTSGGGVISFYLKIANGTFAPCESADFGENILLEYSINGTTWNNMTTYNEGNYANFTFITDTIPLAGYSDSTYFRWRQQSNSGPGNDNWAIDDVTITCFPDTFPPSAAFTGDTLTCDGVVSFQDLSVFADTWYWDFGDGNTDTIQNPVHTYVLNGVYTVKLITTNTIGNDTITKPNYVTVSIGLGPIPDTCSATTATYCCNMGIYNVTFNTIDHTTGNGSVGYMDYSCGVSTTITQGDSISISVQTGPTFYENVRIWIDYDNNGAFDPVSEVVMTSNNFLTNHSAIYIVPYTTVTDTPLRMRVASDYFQTSAPLPCTDVTYGQFEDYTVTILQDTLPPNASFTADVITTCIGEVNFSDLSSRGPTSWYWDFGDGNSDTVQNPTHTYTIDSVFTVTLMVTNPNGSDTIIKNNYITVSMLGMPPASCTPATTGYCCGFGITNVTLNTIDHNTNGGSDGYMDYGCSEQTELFSGAQYTISVTTDTPSEHNIRVWLDYDNNGSFSAGELILSKDNTLVGTGQFTVPSIAVRNVFLRMRVAADYNFEPAPTPCADIVYGQAEDYGIKVLDNPNPPAANFSSDITTTCDGIINFIDLSLNDPVSWQWDFGDTTSDTTQNPTHAYSSDGIYPVKLVVTNINGADSLLISGYINVTLGDGPNAINCEPTTIASCCDYGIYNVQLETINNTTPSDDGYQDYSCEIQTSLKEGKSYWFSATTRPETSQETKVWIDYDNNGIFEADSELVLVALDEIDPIINFTVASNVVLHTPLRMRVSSDHVGANLTPCADPLYGQVEDYGVVILENEEPPIADFKADKITTCDGIIQFTDLSSNNPNSWLWEFGDGTTDTIRHPLHQYQSTGLMTVKLTTSNSFGSNTKTSISYINVFSIDGGPIDAKCTPGTPVLFDFIGIFRVDLNSIINNTQDDGYEDYSCTHQTTLKPGNSYDLTVRTGTFDVEIVIVWIDYNNDGDFDDANEELFQSSGYFHKRSITIPHEAQMGEVLRMRVASEYWDFTPTSCNTVYGDIEDYGILLDTSTSIYDPNLPEFSLMVTPNLSSGQLSINVRSEKPKELHLQVNDLIGQTIYSEKINTGKNSSSIDLEDLPKGLYLITVSDGETQLVEKIILQ